MEVDLALFLTNRTFFQSMEKEGRQKALLETEYQNLEILQSTPHKYNFFKAWRKKEDKKKKGFT